MKDDSTRMIASVRSSDHPPEAWVGTACIKYPNGILSGNWASGHQPGYERYVRADLATSPPAAEQDAEPPKLSSGYAEAMAAAVEYHEDQIDRLHIQIEENDEHRRLSGTVAFDTNNYCRGSIRVHAIAAEHFKRMARAAPDVSGIQPQAPHFESVIDPEDRGVFLDSLHTALLAANTFFIGVAILVMLLK